MSLLDRLLGRERLSETELLNAGLDFAMEFGRNWLQPINQRLMKRFRYLTSHEAEELNTACQAAMRSGHEFIYDVLKQADGKGEKVAKDQLVISFTTHLKDEYEWVNKKNQDRLFSQGMYYAWKDGLDGAMKD